MDTGLFEESALLELYRSLTKVDQLKVIELLMKPTGFTILAGKKDSFKSFENASRKIRSRKKLYLSRIRVYCKFDKQGDSVDFD